MYLSTDFQYSFHHHSTWYGIGTQTCILANTDNSNLGNIRGIFWFNVGFATFIWNIKKYMKVDLLQIKQLTESFVLQFQSWFDNHYTLTKYICTPADVFSLQMPRVSILRPVKSIRGMADPATDNADVAPLVLI